MEGDNDKDAVLYAEDDAFIREVSAEGLEDAGFEVMPVKSGTAALDALDGDASPFCAVVTDVNLGPGPNGWDVARRARSLDDGIPVVYVSGADGHDWNSKGVSRSVILSKPFTILQLVAAIRSLMHKVCRRS